MSFGIPVSLARSGTGTLFGGSILAMILDLNSSEYCFMDLTINVKGQEDWPLARRPLVSHVQSPYGLLSVRDQRNNNLPSHYAP